MDAKVLVSGVIGLGLIGIAGILVLGAGSDSSELTNASATRTAPIEIDPNASAYTIESDPIDSLAAQGTDQQPRDLQAARGNGQREGRGGRGRGGEDWFGRMEERMMQFDTDGDGILDETERDAMAQSFRDRMTDRMDIDGDGFASIEEQFAARKEGMLNSRWGQRERMNFDADGDGELNETELAIFEQNLEDRFDKEYEEIIADYDTDGDGLMSREETIAMQDQQFQQQRSRMDEFTVQFDQDGDGNLNADERIDVRDTMIQRRELESFLRRYDTNKDRQVGTSDYERFTDAYGKKEPYGDVNRDGIFNMDDIVMFRDMSERANAAADN
ncbi:MAG: hypothetical protein AB8C13_00570 [Phycisphaerales bacterium]